MSSLLVLNGPNLNMLGQREPEIYGTQTLDDIKKLCREKADQHDLSLDFRQSNSEGTLVSWIQEAVVSKDIVGIIINAAAYTHTSIAIHDALKMLTIPVIEVHLSDPQAREPFRHQSYIEPLAARVIKGKGAAGYLEAIDYLSVTMQDA